MILPTKNLTQRQNNKSKQIFPSPSLSFLRCPPISPNPVLPKPTYAKWVLPKPTYAKWVLPNPEKYIVRVN